MIGNDTKTMNNWQELLNMPKNDGYFNVLLHGQPDFFQPFNKKDQVFAKDIAKILYANGYQSGTPIRLISCSSGYGGIYMGTGAAYQLARYTKAIVLAPTQEVGINNGIYFIRNEGRWKKLLEKFWWAVDLIW